MEICLNLSIKCGLRVIFASRENYRVVDTNFNIYSAKLAGRLRIHAQHWPTVGDYVTAEPQPGDWWLITAVDKRRSALTRRDPAGDTQVLCANVDLVLIVTSANEDLNLNRLERYLAMAFSGNVRPLIVVNKIELAADPHGLLDEMAHRFPDVDILGVSAAENLNLDGIEEYLHQGITAALVGSSGVGKSTLVNALVGSDRAETQTISASNDRGRHTTTHRELHALQSGAFLIDTPGLRQVGHDDPSGVSSVFGDIEALALQCRFTDCLHHSEPGCAIRGSLASGALTEERWDNYIKLSKELAFERRKTNKALQAEEKKKWAKIHMANRARRK